MLLGLLFTAFLITLTTTSYVLNAKISKPDGCEDLCEGCGIGSCYLRSEKNVD